MRDEPKAGSRRQSARSSRPHKRRGSIQTAGRWSWKSKPAKECVTTHLPNGPALKMDGAEACRPHPAIGAERRGARCVGGRGVRGEAARREPGRSGTPARILVVVASTQTGPLRTEVGKGSMRTAIGHGLVDPERRGKLRGEGCAIGLFGRYLVIFSIKIK